MHDTLRLEERGIPAVALVHDRFEMAARNQSRLLGLASAKMVSIPEPHPGDPESGLTALIDRAWNEIVGALVKS